jgi:peptide deformylase
MPVLPLLSFDDPRLRVPCHPVVNDPGDEIAQLVQDLRDTIKAGKTSIGLAAPQVGILKRVFVMRLDRDKEPVVVINPMIMWTSEGKPGGTCQRYEGCLSFPGTTIKVTRPRAAKVIYQDESGLIHDEELDGIACAVFLHENDHLDGRLIIDHVPASELEAVTRALVRRARRAQIRERLVKLSTST